MTSRASMTPGTEMVLGKIYGHHDALDAVASEQRRVITGSEDGTARIWSFSEKQVESCDVTLEAPPTENAGYGGLTSASFAPCTSTRASDSELVLTSHRDCSVRIWRSTGQLVLSIPPEASAASAASGTEPPTKPRPAVQGKALPKGHQDYVNMAMWHSSGQYVLTCSDDKTAAVWNADTGKCVVSLKDASKGHFDSVTRVAWSQTDDSRLVATASYDGNALVWDWHTGTIFQTLPSHAHLATQSGHAAAVWDVAFSHDDTKLATASKDREAKIWDPSIGALKHTLKGHEKEVLRVCWNPEDSNQIVTCSMDNTAMVWDLRREQAPVTTLDHHTGAVWSVQYGRDPKTIVTGSHDMTALVYDQRLRLPKCICAGHTGILWEAKLSSDDSWLLTGSEDTSTRVWNLMTGARRPPCHILRIGQAGHRKAVTCAAFYETKTDQ
mmetsp:Transcript_46408/g.89484  ORF Transcript_46408/g.89484 Transcript_46408/m.89484 type:complete len:440 (-) Transcript_46408:33-1352(-)